MKVNHDTLFDREIKKRELSKGSGSVPRIFSLCCPRKSSVSFETGNSYRKGDGGAMPRRRRWSERILHRTVNGVMAWHRCTRTPRGGANGTERNGTERSEMKRPERDVACPMLQLRVSQVLHAISRLNALAHEYTRTSFCFFVYF